MAFEYHLMSSPRTHTKWVVGLASCAALGALGALGAFGTFGTLGRAVALASAPGAQCQELLSEGVYDKYVRSGRWSHMDSLKDEVMKFDDHYSYSDYRADAHRFERDETSRSQSTSFSLLMTLWSFGLKPGVSFSHGHAKDHLTRAEFHEAKRTVTQLQSFFRSTRKSRADSEGSRDAVDHLVSPEWAETYQTCLRLSAEKVEIPAFEASSDGAVLDFSLRFTLGEGTRPSQTPRVQKLYVVPSDAARCEFADRQPPFGMEPGVQYSVHCSRPPNATAAAHISVATDRGPFQAALPERLGTSIAVSLEDRVSQLERVVQQVKSAEKNDSRRVVRMLKKGACGVCHRRCGGRFPFEVYESDHRMDWGSNFPHDDCGATLASVDTRRYVFCCIDSSSYTSSE